MSDEYSARFVDNTLIRHDGPKIKKLRMIKYFYNNEYPRLNEIIGFAMRKHVEELILDFHACELVLPEFIFNHSSLVRLKAKECSFKALNGKVSWEHLKDLDLRFCKLDGDAVDNILHGSPVLESLVLELCVEFDRLVIVSKSLKKLKLGVVVNVLEVSCPNLEEFYLFGHFRARATRLMNLTSLNHATLDFGKCDGILYEKILQQLQHVNDLKLGAWFIELLSSLGVRAQSLPLLNNKSLTLYHTNFDKQRIGIAHTLCHSHLLEKLVMKRFFYEVAQVSKAEESCRGCLYEIFFDCPVSNLKSVEIINFSRRQHDYEHVLHFIEFILKYARVLEKLVVVFENDDKDFMLDVSLDLLSFTRCSPDAAIEFRCLVQ